MSLTATIVSLISTIGCLILARRSSAFRQLGMNRTITYAVIWGAIILGLVMVLRMTGLRVGP
jgi:hypothetical protein